MEQTLENIVFNYVFAQYPEISGSADLVKHKINEMTNSEFLSVLSEAMRHVYRRT